MSYIIIMYLTGRELSYIICPRLEKNSQAIMITFFKFGLYVIISFFLLPN